MINLVYLVSWWMPFRTTTKHPQQTFGLPTTKYVSGITAIPGLCLPCFTSFLLFPFPHLSLCSFNQIKFQKCLLNKPLPHSTAHEYWHPCSQPTTTTPRHHSALQALVVPSSFAHFRFVCLWYVAGWLAKLQKKHELQGKLATKWI